MIVALCCTRNWYRYLATNLYALFKHNKVDKVYLFVEDDNIDFINYEQVEFININNLEEYIKPTSPNYKTKYSKMSYIRCYFTKLLKCDKLLYIDADALVIDNINKLWNIDINDYALAGVKESGEWSRHLGIDGMDDKYINSGILLMNLKYIREHKLDDIMIDLLNKNKYWFPDQDVINIVCKDKIKYISNVYNSTETIGFRDDAKIIHYIRERKGWVVGSPKSEIWYNYHNEYLAKEGIMNNYLVRATRNFDDMEYNGEKRVKGVSTWYCSAERYEYLKANNAVELIEIKKVEEDVIPLKPEKLEEVAEEIKEVIVEDPFKDYELPKAKKKSKKSKK